MKKLILLLSTICFLCSCGDDKVKTVEVIRNETPYELKLVFDGLTQTTINIEANGEFRQNNHRGPQEYSFVYLEVLDSVVFDNTKYINIHYGPYSFIYYSLNTMKGPMWKCYDEKPIRYEAVFTMDDYNKAIPIPGKE